SRDRHGSYYGRYVRDEASRLLPVIHQEFVRRVRELPLKRYILDRAISDPPRFERLAAAYNRIVDAYAGSAGFLDRHLAKVFNYLASATMVGRNQSTSGHERHVHAETWNTVAAELRIPITERVDLSGAPARSLAAPPPFDPPGPHSIFRREQ